MNLRWKGLLKLEKDKYFSEKLGIKYINLLGSEKYFSEEGYKEELAKYYDMASEYIDSAINGVNSVSKEDLLDIREAVSKRKDVALSDQIQM